MPQKTKTEQRCDMVDVHKDETDEQTLARR